ncbi:hypothetical protein AB8Z38_17990 [Bradyrhizobium sp. LLZ17]|uniref:Transposase IS111A/IS1328/IS1533 N-terminal domain-containing protein n=1 Tax=Bradyrhizobium sp. LLZ17 TaxID=3239388 RepID=A0AB39XVZ4_9BRAD
MEFYAGLDVSLRAMNVWVVDGRQRRPETTLETSPDATKLCLAKWRAQRKRVGLDAFSYSASLFTALSEKVVPVICIETGRAKPSPNAMLNKTDRNDANGIAQMMGTRWFRGVEVR